jgi:hypothetical protein
MWSTSPSVDGKCSPYGPRVNPASFVLLVCVGSYSLELSSMKSTAAIWWVLLVLGGLGLLYQGTQTEKGLGKVYVKPLRVDADQQPVLWTTADKQDPAAVISPFRTTGIWVEAFLTLAVFSYLYRDNVFYKLAESIIVGVSAGYYLVVGFWDTIVAQLLVKLNPALTRSWALPGIAADLEPDYWYVIPLVLSLFLFSRFIPGYGWLARWPLAFIVGTFAGLRLVLFLDADFISQIRNTIVPLIVLTDGQLNFWASVRNLGLMLSLLSCLTYFFFSVPHRGWIGRTARLGTWVLMITFGASFAFTVMGRITLLTKRFEFLFRDWLQLIE